jgi:hypothetical protein
MYDTRLLDNFDNKKKEILARKSEHKNSQTCIGTECVICKQFDKEYEAECNRQSNFFSEGDLFD